MLLLPVLYVIPTSNDADCKIRVFIPVRDFLYMKDMYIFNFYFI